MNSAQSRAYLVKSAETILLFWYGIIYSFILITALSAVASVMTMPIGWMMPLFTFAALLPSPALLLVFLFIAAVAVSFLVEERSAKRGMMFFATFISVLAASSIYYFFKDTNIFKFLAAVCKEFCAGAAQ